MFLKRVHEVTEEYGMIIRNNQAHTDLMMHKLFELQLEREANAAPFAGR